MSRRRQGGNPWHRMFTVLTFVLLAGVAWGEPAVVADLELSAAATVLVGLDHDVDEALDAVFDIVDVLELEDGVEVFQQQDEGLVLLFGEVARS